MKNNSVLILAIIAFTFAGCTKNKPEPTPEKENIKLSKYRVFLDYDNPKDTIRILDGNRGYEINPGFNPNIPLVKNNGDELRMINEAFRNKLNVTVQGDSIIIVDRFYDKDTTILVHYRISDAKDKYKNLLILPCGFEEYYLSLSEKPPFDK